MHLAHLRLRDFRNYARLDADFGPGFHLLLGSNAQGKTNILEAIYLLATLRSLGYAVSRNKPYAGGFITEHYGNPGTGLTLQEGMVFTIEPMLNLGKRHVKILPDGWTAVTKDHSLSAQWEHMVAVTSEGFEILTRRAEEPLDIRNALASN